MKKIFFIILTIFILSSCSVTTYLVADISLMNTDGKVIDKWDNAIMQSFTTTTSGKYATSGGIKNGGVNFKDSANVYHYISGGIIHVDNLKEITESKYNKQKAVPLFSEYERLSKLYENDKKTLIKIKKTDEEYSLIKERMEKVLERLRNIKQELWNYGYTIKS